MSAVGGHGVRVSGLARRSEVARALEPHELSLLFGAMRPRRVLAGEVLFELGEPAQALYLVRSGRVALSLPLEVRRIRRDLTVEEEGPGAVLGWSALVAPHRHTASARALEDGTVGIVEGAALQALLARHPATRDRLSRTVSDIMRRRFERWQAMAVQQALHWVGLA